MKPAKKATKAEPKKETLEITMSVVRGDVDDIIERINTIQAQTVRVVRVCALSCMLVAMIVFAGMVCIYGIHRKQSAKITSTKSLYTNAASTAVNRY